MGIVVPTKTSCCLPNNRLWITSDVMYLLNKKKRVFKDGDQIELKHIQRELKYRLKKAKEAYRMWKRSCKKTT